jgi:uncharacterized protein (TIGR03067 family)
MFFQVLLVGPILFLPIVLEPDVIEFPGAEFRIPYLTRADAKAKADHFRIFVSTDQGKTWKHENDIKPGDDLKFQAPKDGLYWLAVQTVWKDGQMSPMEVRSASLKVFVNTQRRPVIRPREPAANTPGAKEAPIPPPPDETGLWSRYGRLEKTRLKCENGQPVYALKDRDTLITYVAAKPGKSLADYVGKRISVYGHTEADELIRYVVATYVAQAAIDAASEIDGWGEADKKELNRFQGIWAPQSAIFDGKAQEEEVIKDRAVLVIAANFIATEKRVEVTTSSMRIDSSKSPAHLDTTCERGPGKGETLKGIYRFDGETLTICIASAGKDRPTEFTSEPGSGRMLYVLKRKK